MAHQLRCKFCGKSHKATEENFPLVVKELREVFEGKGKKRKSLGHQHVIVGYGCRKCDRKNRLAQFIKEQNIKPAPGQRMSSAIKEKIGELELKDKKSRITKAPEKKQSLIQKGKSWITEKFRTRGRE